MSLREGSVTQYRFHCHFIGLDDRGPHTPSCPHTCHRLQELTRYPAKDYKAFNTLKGLNNVGSFSSYFFSFIFSVSRFLVLVEEQTCNHTHTHTLTGQGTKKEKWNQCDTCPTSRQIERETTGVYWILRDWWKILNLILHHLPHIWNVSIYTEINGPSCYANNLLVQNQDSSLSRAEYGHMMHHATLVTPSLYADTSAAQYQQKQPVEWDKSGKYNNKYYILLSRLLFVFLVVSWILISFCMIFILSF